MFDVRCLSFFAESPSSRRAWIEIQDRQNALLTSAVALLAEGVDRNLLRHVIAVGVLWSPSSRRAWIEMYP